MSQSRVILSYRTTWRHVIGAAPMGTLSTGVRGQAAGGRPPRASLAQADK
jgi:hypothetical protein